MPGGKIRSWQAYMVAHALYYQQIYSYFGILEALSGMAVEVEFLSLPILWKMEFQKTLMLS